MEELTFSHLRRRLSFGYVWAVKWICTLVYDPDRLAGLRFNPLLAETYKKFSLCSDHDPDAIFFSELADCEYYIEEKFNEILQQKNMLGGNSFTS